MTRKHSFALLSLIAATLVVVPATARAHPDFAAQVCTLATAAVGQPGNIVCSSISTGAITQSIAVGNTVVGSGATGGTLSRHRDAVLVTNLAGGAVLLREARGQLSAPVTLQTGEASLSGALDDRGAYVLTGTRLYFFANGKTKPTSSQPLLNGDGSAAQVTLAGGHAYVSEKSGSLEAFSLAANGNISSAATPVAGIPAGVIVGITGHDDLVVAPVAHLASNADQSTIPVASGLGLAQLVQTKEVAACWAATGDDEVCVTNPGSMTVSCGHIGAGGFTSYTSVAANPAGEALFDLDVRGGLVGILGTHNGVPVLLAYSRSEEGSDFLSLIRESSVGSAHATGALLLPSLAR
jgi:hypothetical protein